MNRIWNKTNNTLEITLENHDEQLSDATLELFKDYGWITEKSKNDDGHGVIEITLRAFLEAVDKSYCPVSDSLDSDTLSSLSERLFKLLKPVTAQISIDSPTGLIHNNKNPIEVEYVSADNQFKLSSDENSGATLSPVLEYGGVMHPLDYQIIRLALEQTDNKTQRYRKFEKIKRKIKESDYLKQNIRVNPWIENKNFQTCSSIAPAAITNQHGNVDFFATLKTSQNSEPIKIDENLLSEGVARTKDGELFILTETQEQFLKNLAPMKHYSRKEALRYLERPQELVPEAVDYEEEIDLSQLSPRLLGFEEVSRGIYFDTNSNHSGIQWFSEQKQAGLFLPLGQRDNAVFGIELRDKDDALKLLQQCKNEIARAENESRTPDKIEYNGISFEPNQHRINELEKMTAQKKHTEDKNQNVTYEAAIVSSLESEKLIELNHHTINLKQSLEPHLKESVSVLPHQAEAIQWLYNSIKSGRTGAQLCDDMGLGKTLTLLSFLRVLAAEDKLSRCLVVCPVILINNWETEAQKFFNLERYELPTVLHGASPQNIERLVKNSWISIINYESLLKNQRLLASIPFDVVILDESQRIKNPDVATSRICRALNRKFLITSTGTPVENCLLDLWTQTDAAMQDFHPLGSRKEFESREKNESESLIEYCRTQLRIHEKNTLILHRKKQDVLKHLPAKKFNYYELKMTEIQQQLENTIKASNARIFSKLADLQKLYQHPTFLNPDINTTCEQEYIKMSPKLEWLVNLIHDNWLKNEKTLVFILHKEMQIRIADLLKKRYNCQIPIINGDTNSGGQNRALIKIDEFKHGDSPAMILSPIAAGAGLNITCANHVVHFHRWWNPAKENQATDRAYRIGQKKEVFVHYPILVNGNSDVKSFDEKLNDLIKQKIEMAHDFLKPVTDDENAYKGVFNDE